MAKPAPVIDLTFSLAGRIALVTGAASGIGAAIAETYAAKGATIAAVDLSLAATGAKAAELGDSSKGFACDVSDPASVEATVASVIDEFGRIDVLVNSAGIVALAPAEDITQTAWTSTIAVNLSGTFYMCQAVGRHMLAAGDGKIINLASQAGSVAIGEHVAYCASKFGVIGMTRVLALEWAGRGVTVNTISPTIVLTELGKKAWDGAKGEAAKTLIPVGRFAQPDEIAAAALFLASNGADMINGADLVIDGGWTIH
jgi:NAD(P)-dependent dehydrogenase (short-subunit alcohol dehydrogenase family)